MNKKIILLSASLFLCLLVIPKHVLAVTTVTPATGGSAISADTTGGAYTSLTGPIIAEGLTADIGTGTIILNAPTGFIFDVGGTVPTVLITRTAGTGGGGDNINGKNSGTSDNITSITTTLITFTVTGASKNGAVNTLTWQNVRVRPTVGTPLASGNLTKTGTSVIPGVTNSVTNLGSLTEVAGVKTQLVFTTQPSAAATAGVDFTTKPVSMVRDQFSNTVTSDNATTVILSPILSTQTCGGVLGSGILTSTPASGATVTSGVMTYTAMQYSVAESIKVCATSSGITSALSDTIVVAAGPTPTPIPTPTPGSSQTGTGTINVVKIVVNDNGKTKAVSDFPLFINGQSAVSGQTYTFPAPGPALTVTETGDPNYTLSFSGDCDTNGQLNLNSGENKFCIVTNNDIGSALSVPPTPPLISVVIVPNPLALSTGPGPVTYTHTMHNIGTVPVTDITMISDTCNPIVLVSGDTNSDAKLDVNETWVYRCTAMLTETHTSTVVATGWANGISAVDIAKATVVVSVPGLPETGLVHPLIHVTKVPSPLTLPAEGGWVTYTSQVTNLGSVALSNIRLSDDRCSPVIYVSGDLNGDLKLDTTETWTYACRMNIIRTTTNTVTASGDANGLTERDFAIAIVVVAAPDLPTYLLQQIRAITVNLSLGSVGDDVRILQEFLIFENKGPAALVLAGHGTTLNFGLMTQAALLEWQKAVGIAFPTGNFGPATRDYISTHYFVTSNPGFPDTGLPSTSGFTSLSALSLEDGDTISATGSSDPDIYIANTWGYKRLFLNPVIFGFYGHLGGFVDVKTIAPTTRDTLVTSGLFRNCETNDPRVYGVEVTGEDAGVLHWVNTTGEQATADDPNFFKKVFCINNNEFNWYQKGSNYTSVNQVPVYTRTY